jgi:hypothetical protein
VSSRQILVIEDEFLIGLEIHSLLTEAGFGVVGPATTVPAALKHISGVISTPHWSMRISVGTASTG